jgi:precorrin-6B methylase 1
MPLSPHQACYFAHELTRLGEVGEFDRLSSTMFDSKVDLNPHQVEAALFAMSNPLQNGVILADEVGLGKTIEAGLVLCQKWAERLRKLIVVCPAHIRKQWQTELAEKFSLPSIVMDRKVWRQLHRDGHQNPLDCGKIIVMSYGLASRMKEDLRAVPFDLVVLDEAHKLRNAYQPSRKGGQAIRWAFELRQKILMTATPLQNTLLELYGLGWLIGDHVFGDKNAFQRQFCRVGGDVSELRRRLSQLCIRTLRKDCPYVNYTKRQAITHPFKQTEEEKALQRDVTEFMLREISYAFPAQHRHLIEIVLFKTLASSPQALASTLRMMRQRLVDLRDGLNDDDGERFLAPLEEDEFDVEALLDQFDVDEDETIEAAPLPSGRLLAAELAELESLIERAERIKSDSKSAALLTAMEVAFDRLHELGAKRKALIFTESRKTQEFLASYLESNGYAGKVVVFNGSNRHESAKRAYDRFISDHAGTDKVTGSRPIDIRSALIEEFLERGDILLATEAAAEGVNLQFCSLVVNYDLPWNPQRIEQRIGRCHRYGQHYDVVVVNFLSQDNIADRRVQDLLQQKFSLFDGLFGASDEVLGTIEDGVDFENRVLEILKSCRTEEEINAAFDKLQHDLEAIIKEKMTEARRQVLEHFDADVHERLRVRGEHAQIALDRVGDRFWRLTHWGLDGRAEFDDNLLGFHLSQSPSPDIPTGEYRLISRVRTDEDVAAIEAHLHRLSSPLGQWLLDTAKAQSLQVATVRFDVTNHPRKISMLQPLVGGGGWLRLDKFTLDSDTREEFLLLTAVTDAGDNLDQERAQRLLDVSGVEVAPVTCDESTAARLAADADRLTAATLARASENGNARFLQVQAQVNQWADDKIAAAEMELDSVKRELRAARRDADLSENVQAQQVAQMRVAQLERKRRRARNNIDDVEDAVEAERQRLIQQLRERCQQHQQRETLFTIRFDIV